jgi:hypothetical protein
MDRQVGDVVWQQAGVAGNQLAAGKVGLPSHCQQDVGDQCEVQHLLDDDAPDQHRRIGVAVFDRVEGVQVRRDRRRFDSGGQHRMPAKVFGVAYRHRSLRPLGC